AAAMAPAGARWHVAGSLAEAVEGRDLVVVAVPLPALDEVLHGLVSAGYAGLVTDVASVKGPVYELVGQRLHGPHTRLAGFVGGHPMACRETSGFTAADPDLYTGCAWALCLEPDTALVEWVILADLLTPLCYPGLPTTPAAH